MTEAQRQAVAADYVLPVLLDLDEASWAELRPRVCYGRQARAGGTPALRIVPSDFFAVERYGLPRSVPGLPLRNFRGVPLLFGEDVVVAEAGGLELHADLVASSFFLLARYEEWIGEGKRDEFGRLRGGDSFAGRAGLLARPLVEQYGRALRLLCHEAGIPLPAARRREFDLVLTHDLDNHRQFHGWRTACGESARFCTGRSSGSRLRQAWACALGLARDPYDTYPEIFSLAREAQSAPGGRGTRSVHFIMAGGNSRYDRLYDLDDPAVRGTLAGIRDSGAEIGLHVSFEAGGDAALIGAEKVRLEQAIGRPVTSSRHHYLRFIYPEHAAAMSSAGLTDDYILCFPDRLGFRLGVARPVPAFDVRQFRPLQLVCHPTTVMDATLDNPAYLGLPEEEAFAEVVAYVKEVRSWAGELVLLWHNCRLARTGGGYHANLYPRLVRHIQAAA